MPRLAVLGQPISHSRSPIIHNAALAELGLAGEWSYEAIEVSPEGFEARVRAMPGEGFVGANVTVPHKLAALRVADRASAAAREIGASNTLSFGEGRIEAENTDATGFLESLPESPGGTRALVLGAGGSARAIVWALVTKGASVAVWNRTRSRAEQLAAQFGAGVADPDPSDHRLATRDYDLIVNATSVGLAAANPGADAPAPPPGADLDALHLSADELGEGHVVVDLVYGSRETELVGAATAAGARAIDGLEVLVCQGAASLRLWIGEEPPIETMRRAARG